MISVDSVKRCTTVDQTVRGGAVPTSTLHFCTNQWDDARRLVLRYHYSELVPPVSTYCFTLHLDGGLFGDFGNCVAACIFGIPSVQWKEPVLELTRLVRVPEYKPSLTQLLSRSCKYLKAQGVDLLVSYADKGQNHNGYVYRAANWNLGYVNPPRLVGLTINNKAIHGRQCSHLYGSRSARKVIESNPELDVKPLYDGGKILYWKALGTRGMAKAQRLGL